MIPPTTPRYRVDCFIMNVWWEDALLSTESAATQMSCARKNLSPSGVSKHRKRTCCEKVRVGGLVGRRNPRKKDEAPVRLRAHVGNCHDRPVSRKRYPIATDAGGPSLAMHLISSLG